MTRNLVPADALQAVLAGAAQQNVGPHRFPSPVSVQFPKELLMVDPLKVIRYEAAEAIAFGPLSDYRALVSDDCSDLTIRTGIQTCRPGYEAKPHWHPYVEILHILDGAAEAWEVGRENSAVMLRAGDTVVIPARTWHS